MASDWGPGVSVSPVENLTTDTLSNFVVEVNGDTSFLHIDGSTLPPTLSLDNVASIEQTVIVVDNLCQSGLVDINERREKTNTEAKYSPQGQTSGSSSPGSENLVSLTRKSERERRGKRAYSPTPVTTQKGGKRKRQVGNGRKADGPASSSPLADKGPGGKPFCCDLCKSPYICNPTRRNSCHGKKPKTSPNPRYRIHPNTGRVLTLCNACGLCLGRVRAPKVPKPPALSGVEKQSYLQEAARFGASLAEELGDPDAKKLYCPKVKNKPCGCVQNFITGDESDDTMKARGHELLQIHKEAKRLSQEKWQNEDDQSTPGGSTKKKSRAVGLGNGKRKSKAFEDFVLSKRAYLKKELGLCEYAIQTLLVYSNNFLHKRLKTQDSRFRAPRSKGKAALGQLVPIADLPRMRCCLDNCVMMALTHGRLLEQWRERAKMGQAEARRVTAEMLTPSGGARSNCYNFITCVTGCSQSTISKVNEQMRQTGGDREPPEHGLKKYWRKLATSKMAPPVTKDSLAAIEQLPVDEVGPDSPSSLELDDNMVDDDQQLHQLQQQQLQQQQLDKVTDNNVDSLSTAASSTATQAATTTTTTTTTISAMELESQREQLLALQKQIMKQQLQLQAQQQLLEQQLMQQLLQQQQLQQQQQQPLNRVTVDKMQVSSPGQVILGDPNTSLASVNPTTLSLLIPSCGRAPVQTLPSVETIGRKLLPSAEGLSPRSLRYIAGQKLTTNSDDHDARGSIPQQQQMIPITVDSWHQQFLSQTPGKQYSVGGALSWQPISDTEPRLFSDQTRFANVLSDIVDVAQPQSDMPVLHIDDGNPRSQSSSMPQVAPQEAVHEVMMPSSMLLPSDVPKFHHLQDMLLQKDCAAVRLVDANHDVNNWLTKNKHGDKTIADSNSSSTLPTSNSIVMNVLHSQALVQHIMETSQDTANNTAGVTNHSTVDTGGVIDGDTGQFQERCANL